MFTYKKAKLVFGLLIGAAMMAVIACGGDPETITVVQTVIVPGDTVVQTVVITEKGEEVVVTATAVGAAPTAAPEDLITAPDTSTPAGMAVIAVGGTTMGSEVGMNSQTSNNDGYKNNGIAETLFLRAADDSHLPWLATGFTIASDLSSATVTIKQGVSFQIVDGNDFGMMTAHDVAYSMNDANSVTNPESIHGQAGDFAGLWGEWIAIDDETIEFEFTAYDSTWKDDYVNNSGQAFVVYSQTARDQMGDSWAKDHVVATGVYQVEEWLRDESFTVVARPNHHLFTAKTERIKQVQVTEATTRASLLRNGQVDIAALEPKDAAKFDPTEFTATSTGGDVQLGIFFSGNLWEDVYAGGENEGLPLPTKATFVHDLPWIGKPGTTHGADDLEQARNIRRALAIAIDRELVNETLLAGLGSVVHVEYFSAQHPNWDAKWEYPYDPDAAIDLIMAQDNDYQHGSAPKDGPLGAHAFEISVYAGPELGGGQSVTGEVADAVAGFWADIGLTTFSLKFSYQTFRPTVVGRANTHPWVTSCDKGKASNPWHFPKGLVQTTLTRGGFACGFESPVILGLYRRMAEAADTASATAAATEYLDYVYDQNLQPGIVGVPENFFFNNKKVKSWNMDKAAAGNLNTVWNIELN